MSQINPSAPLAPSERSIASEHGENNPSFTNSTSVTAHSSYLSQVKPEDIQIYQETLGIAVYKFESKIELEM